MSVRLDLPEPGAVNTAQWTDQDHVAAYATRVLRPVEVLLMVRHREQLAGRVLELGCGAGRITGYLAALSHEVTGLDVSSRMLDECRRRYPAGRFIEGDLGDLSRFAEASFDVVVAGYNVLDIVGDADRRRILGEIHRILTPGGLLIMSSHNRAFLPRVRGPRYVRRVDPLRFAVDLGRVPRRISRHRRLAALERDEPRYAIVCDGTGDFLMVHYYTTPESQFQQFEEEGFEPLSCEDLEGRPVGGDYRAPESPELHYVARTT